MIVSLKSASERAIGDVIERRERGDSLVGVSTGFTVLDNALGGFRKNALYIVGGRTGMGKTAFSMTLGMNVAIQEKHVLYCSLEMSAELLALRVISAATGVPALDIEQAKISDHQLETVRDTVNSFTALPLYINDATMSSDDLVTVGHAMKEKKELDFMIIDYMSLLTDRGDNEVQRLEGIVGRVRALATDLDIPILGVVQLNRDVENQEGGRPSLKHIRYSDRISHDAFAAMFVHRPATYMLPDERAHYSDKEDNAELLLEKNRQGPTGMIPMTFYPKMMKWEPRILKPLDPKPTHVRRT